MRGGDRQVMEGVTHIMKGNPGKGLSSDNCQ